LHFVAEKLFFVSSLSWSPNQLFLARSDKYFLWVGKMWWNSYSFCLQNS